MPEELVSEDAEVRQLCEAPYEGSLARITCTQPEDHDGWHTGQVHDRREISFEGVFISTISTESVKWRGRNYGRQVSRMLRPMLDE